MKHGRVNIRTERQDTECAYCGNERADVSVLGDEGGVVACGHQVGPGHHCEAQGDRGCNNVKRSCERKGSDQSTHCRRGSSRPLCDSRKTRCTKKRWERDSGHSRSRKHLVLPPEVLQFFFHTPDSNCRWVQHELRSEIVRERGAYPAVRIRGVALLRQRAVGRVRRRGKIAPAVGTVPR